MCPKGVSSDSWLYASLPTCVCMSVTWRWSSQRAFKTQKWADATYQGILFWGQWNISQHATVGTSIWELSMLPLAGCTTCQVLYLICPKELHIHWVGHLLPSTWNLDRPQSLATAAGTWTTHTDQCTRVHLTVPWALPIPCSVPDVEAGEPIHIRAQLEVLGVDAGDAGHVDWWGMTVLVLPSLVSQEDTSNMHFLSLPKNWALYLCFLIQSIDSQPDFGR